MKKGKELSPLELMYAIGMVDERYLAECETAPASVTRKTKLKRRYISYISAAACFVMIITGIYLTENLYIVKNAESTQDEMSDTSTTDADSKETVTETGMLEYVTDGADCKLPSSDENASNENGSIRFPGSLNGSVTPDNAEAAPAPNATLDITGAGDLLIADEIRFLSDADLAANFHGTISDESRLAVFSNSAGYGLTGEEMAEKADAISEMLGGKTESETMCGTASVSGESVTVEKNKIDSGYTLSVYSTGDWELSFAHGETYDISDDDKLRGAAISAAQSFSSLLGYSVPEVYITHSRSADGTLMSEARVYDAGDGTENSYAEREFSYMMPEFDDSGKLCGIYVRDCYMNGVTYYGTYDVIGYEDAVRELDEGCYISAYPAGDKLSSRIAVCESAYIYSRSARCLIPYYKFTVRLDGSTKDGLYAYGSYYVPAIDPSEISGGT